MTQEQQRNTSDGQEQFGPELFDDSFAQDQPLGQGSVPEGFCYSISPWLLRHFNYLVGRIGMTAAIDAA